jgi:cellulose biosynthesis protein BcsQ
LLIDADTQQTASDWFNKRDNQDNPLVISATDHATLENLLPLAEKKVSNGFLSTRWSRIIIW